MVRGTSTPETPPAAADINPNIGVIAPNIWFQVAAGGLSV